MTYDLDHINRQRRLHGKPPITRAQAETTARHVAPGFDLNAVLIAAVTTAAFSSSSSDARADTPSHTDTPSHAHTPSFVAGGGDYGGGGGSSGSDGGGGGGGGGSE
jgi:hypothetical protein